MPPSGPRSGPRLGLAGQGEGPQAVGRPEPTPGQTPGQGDNLHVTLFIIQEEGCNLGAQ